MSCCNKTDATLVEYTGRCLKNIGVTEGHTLDHALKKIDTKSREIGRASCRERV